MPKGYKREVKGEIITETTDDGHHVHSHDINSSYEGNWILTDTLKAGDLVEFTPMKGDGDGYENANS